jgi:peroxiredoxin Q/BCP
MRPTNLLPLVALALGLALPAVPGPARADTADPHYYVRVGDRPPTIELLDDEGKKWKLSDHVGKRVLVLFFYQGDFFPQSIREAAAFRDDLARIKQQGVEVVGISGDLPANHRMFKETYKLNFTLLSDAKGDVGTRFGMPMSAGGTRVIKDSEGGDIHLVRGATAPHWTWVIGLDGKVLDKGRQVKPAEESKRILALLNKWRGQRR